MLDRTEQRLYIFLTFAMTVLFFIMVGKYVVAQNYIHALEVRNERQYNMIQEYKERLDLEG